MNKNIENGQDHCCVEDDFPPPPPPLESDWRLRKYFDAMNNVDCCPDQVEFEEIEGYLSNCTDTDLDESASVLYAYNYLKEYVQHMKSAKQAKDNLMSALPSQQRSPTSQQDSDTSPNRYQNSKSASGDDMETYDHLSGREECYYASMQMRADYKPQMDVRRTLSDGPDKIAHMDGYAIPYVTRHRTMPQNLRPPIHGTVSLNYPNNMQRHEQAEVVEICSPSDTSMSSTPYWLHRPPGRNERIVYESIDRMEKHESDEYFLPRAKDKRSTTDSSNSNQNISNDANRTNQKRRKFKRPNNRKIYVTTSKVFNQPIIHSKECLDSLNSDEVRPCNCLKTVLVNQNMKQQQQQQQHSPSKTVHVMESIQDGEISNFNQIRKKKLNRTRGIDDWGVDYPQEPYNSSDNLYPDEFDTYDHASNHAFASRSLNSYNSSTANGSTNDSDSVLVHSGSHVPYIKESMDESSDEVGNSMMYLPSERWNFAFVPYKPNQNNRAKVTRFHSVDIANNSENRSTNLEDFKSNSSFSSKSDQNSSSCSSRCSANVSKAQNKNFTKSFFKGFSPKISKKHIRAPAKGQVSEL